MSLTPLAGLIWSCLQAGVMSLLAGAFVCGLLSLALRRWPALAARRSVWVSGLAVVLAVLVLALLPQTARWSLLPPVSLELMDAAPAVSSVPANALAPVLPPLPAANSWHCLPYAFFLVYLAGLVVMAWRRQRAARLWRGLLLTARRLDDAELAAHPAFGPAQWRALRQQRLIVLETDVAISPLLFGLLKPRLLLPRHLRDFSPQQQQLVVEHELTHQRRRDPGLLALALWLQTVLWFNPALPWLSRRLAWAQELGCDRAVLAGRAPAQRLAYAAALVQQLKVQSMVLAPGLAFGATDASAVAARIALLRQPHAAMLSAGSKWGVGAALAGIVAASVVLQPVLGGALPQPSELAQVAPVRAGSASTVAVWRMPLARVRVSGFFGVVSKLLPNGRHGIDFAAGRGTPILSVAAGTGVTAGTDGRYGNYVVIAHALQRRSLYAHMEGMTVRAGDHVASGAVIGSVGATGFATGPHLHLEVFVGDRLVDPQLLLAGLDGKATRRALQLRRAQRERRAPV